MGGKRTEPLPEFFLPKELPTEWTIESFGAIFDSIDVDGHRKPPGNHWVTAWIKLTATSHVGELNAAFGGVATNLAALARLVTNELNRLGNLPKRKSSKTTEENEGEVTDRRVSGDSKSGFNTITVQKYIYTLSKPPNTNTQRKIWNGQYHFSGLTAYLVKHLYGRTTTFAPKILDKDQSLVAAMVKKELPFVVGHFVTFSTLMAANNNDWMSFENVPIVIPQEFRPLYTSLQIRSEVLNEKAAQAGPSRSKRKSSLSSARASSSNDQAAILARNKQRLLEDPVVKCFEGDLEAVKHDLLERAVDIQIRDDGIRALRKQICEQEQERDKAIAARKLINHQLTYMMQSQRGEKNFRKLHMDYLHKNGIRPSFEEFSQQCSNVLSYFFDQLDDEACPVLDRKTYEYCTIHNAKINPEGGPSFDIGERFMYFEEEKKATPAEVKRKRKAPTADKDAKIARAGNLVGVPMDVDENENFEDDSADGLSETEENTSSEINVESTGLPKKGFSSDDSDSSSSSSEDEDDRKTETVPPKQVPVGIRSLSTFDELLNQRENRVGDETENGGGMEMGEPTSDKGQDIVDNPTTSTGGEKAGNNSAEFTEQKTGSEGEEGPGGKDVAFEVLDVNDYSDLLKTSEMKDTNSPTDAQGPRDPLCGEISQSWIASE